MTPTPVASYEVLGCRIDALTVERLHDLIGEYVTRGDPCIIASRNLHALYVARRDRQMRAFYRRADYVRIDGMSLALWARALGYPVTRDHRVTWVDWLRPLLKEATRRGWRVFYLGSEPGVAEEGARVLRNELPGVELTTEHGFFDAAPGSAENERVCEAIRRYQPHLLLVGMGMPRQERWILENVDSLPPMVVMPCGACIDYVAGVNRTPPRWMGRVGLEWLARLTSDPRRLWRRYLMEPWFLTDLFVKDVVALAKRRLAR